MPIEVLDTGDVARIMLSGRMDFMTAQAMDAPLNAVAETRRAMVIDLSGVEFMASLGLRSLIKCAKTMNKRQGRLALLSPQPVIAEILQVSGIEELIPIFNTEAEALAAVTPA